MPVFRINGMLVHLKLSGKAKNAKACREPIQLDGRTVACLGFGDYLCDHKMPEGGTCDRPLCKQHAKQVGPDEHLCPEHAAAQAASNPELF